MPLTNSAHYELIGTILKYPSLIREVTLSEDHFYDLSWLYRLMREIDRE